MNPFKVGKDGTLDEVLIKYHNYLITKLKENIYFISPLIGKTLGCWCSPNKCHAHILKSFIEKEASLMLLGSMTSSLSYNWVNFNDIRWY